LLKRIDKSDFELLTFCYGLCCIGDNNIGLVVDRTEKLSIAVVVLVGDQGNMRREEVTIRILKTGNLYQIYHSIDSE
jgi:hypothetical protein